MHVKIGITQGRMLDVMPLEDGAGAEMKIKLEGGLQHVFQIDVVRDSIPSNIPLLFAIRDINMNILVSQEINESRFVYQQFTPSVTAYYYITVTQNTAVSPLQSFYLDNFYIYALPASGQDFVSLYLPDVLAYNDYYPFGMQVPNRFASIEDYRFGFQGQEKDDEIKGEGNSLNYTFRMHDPRVGRFFAVDPLFRRYPFYTPYSFSGNRVIDALEIEGLEPHVLFDNITDAAENFGKEYNGYSIRRNVEIATQFYLVVDSDGIKRYAYTTPVYGEYNYVNPKNSNDIPDHAISYVGDGHTHGKELDSDKKTLYSKKSWSLRDTDEIATDSEVKNYINVKKIYAMKDFYFVEGSNGPSSGDMTFWQKQITDLGDNFFRSYLFTPSGLVYTVQNVDGEPIATIQRKLSETNPSDPNSRTRMNEVSPGLPNDLPAVKPEPHTEKVDPDKP